MKKKLNILTFFALLVLALSSCILRPRNVLSRSEMEKVLYDLHKTDGVIFVEGLNYNHDEQLKLFYQTTLQKHGITQAQFDSSLVWYTDNPKRFNKIYPTVVKRLEAELESFAWLDQHQNKDVLLPSDIKPYDIDSLIRIYIEGVPMIYEPKIMQPLESDTSLYYLFPLETIDSISGVIKMLSQDISQELPKS